MKGSPCHAPRPGRSLVPLFRRLCGFFAVLFVGTAIGWFPQPREFLPTLQIKLELLFLIGIPLVIFGGLWLAGLGLLRAGQSALVSFAEQEGIRISGHADAPSHRSHPEARRKWRRVLRRELHRRSQRRRIG